MPALDKKNQRRHSGDMKTKFVSVFCLAAIVGSALTGCATKNIPELKVRSAVFVDIPECRDFDVLLKKRKKKCDVDSDCFEIATPGRGANCYVAFTGNNVDKDRLLKARNKCDEFFRDESFCESSGVPETPMCKRGVCEMVENLK